MTRLRLVGGPADGAEMPSSQDPPAEWFATALDPDQPAYYWRDCQAPDGTWIYRPGQAPD